MSMESLSRALRRTRPEESSTQQSTGLSSMSRTCGVDKKRQVEGMERTRGGICLMVKMKCKAICIRHRACAVSKEMPSMSRIP